MNTPSNTNAYWASPVPNFGLISGRLMPSQPPPPRRPEPGRAKGAGMLRSFIVLYGWEPVAWFGLSVAAFFGALVCLWLHISRKG